MTISPLITMYSYFTISYKINMKETSGPRTTHVLTSHNLRTKDSFAHLLKHQTILSLIKECNSARDIINTKPIIQVQGMKSNIYDHTKIYISTMPLTRLQWLWLGGGGGHSLLSLLQNMAYMTGHMTTLSLQNTQIIFDFLVVSG